MAPQLKYQELIKNLLSEYATLKPSYGNIDSHVVFDDQHGSYVLMQVGWDNNSYVHGSVIHVELIDNKIWIQYDGTEEGIAHELVEAGVPKDHIVLGFRPEQIRQYTGFAIN